MLDRNRLTLFVGYLLIGLIIVLGTLNVSELGHTSSFAGNMKALYP